MVELSAGLSPATLDAIADLERRVVAADGGRLKLEWNTLRHRSGRQVEDVLWWDGERLVGFLGLYVHGAPAVEMAGMVDPDARGRGIGGALLDAGLRLSREREHAPILLVVPRESAAGAALARQRGGRPDHSEHALRLTGEPAEVAADPRITVRPATTEDGPALRELLRRGFGWEPPEKAVRDPNTLVIELDGRPVGTVRLIFEAGQAGVYGFTVDPDHQGHGIGRDVLHRLCVRARAEGAEAVHLEVATDNDRALGLYTSLGFRPVITEDYYAFS